MARKKSDLERLEEAEAEANAGSMSVRAVRWLMRLQAKGWRVTWIGGELSLMERPWLNPKCRHATIVIWHSTGRVKLAGFRGNWPKAPGSDSK